jgi:hypothetical protein
MNKADGQDTGERLSAIVVFEMTKGRAALQSTFEGCKSVMEPTIGLEPMTC